MRTSALRVHLAIFTTALALAACGGGGGSGSGPGVPVPQPSSTVPPSSPTPSATPTPPVAGSSTIQTSAGATIGKTSSFSTEGNTPSGGTGQPVDGVTCDTTMSENYHVHVYLGVIVNGEQMALPAGAGMVNPQPPSAGFVNLASCFYHLHTHDSSGIVHVEDPNPQNLPIQQSMYTLKTFLDEWGVTADANHFGPFSGPVEVFTSGQTYQGNSNGGTVDASSYTYYGADPTNIPLYSHEVIWVEVGPTYPASLPSVHYYLSQ